MKDKIKNMSTKTTALFAAAILMLAVAGVSFTSAVLNIFSDEYNATLNVAEQMKVTILEGTGDDVTDAGESEAVLKAFKDENGEDILIDPGKVYDETLAAKNDSSRPMYVRMIVRKYWMDQDGNKGTFLDGDLDLDPEMIRLAYGEEDYNSEYWIRNEDEHTSESDTYYYKTILTDTTEPLFDGVSIDPAIVDAYDVQETEEEEGITVLTYTYDYDGCKVCLEVEAQAVQTHNAEDAIKSVWGVDATISGDSIESIG